MWKLRESRPCLEGLLPVLHYKCHTERCYMATTKFIKKWSRLSESLRESTVLWHFLHN